VIKGSVVSAGQEVDAQVAFGVSGGSEHPIRSRDTDPRWDQRAKLLGPFILVRRCFNGHVLDEGGSVALYVTDKAADRSNWAEILQVSQRCKEYTQENVGWFVRCPEWGDGMHSLGADYWVIDERLIEKAVKRGVQPDLIPCVVKP